jgi:lysophospholipase L1-like esterase
MTPRKIIFIGNSFVEGVGDSERGGWTRRVALGLSYEWDAIHRGVGGDNIKGVLNRFPTDVILNDPKIVVVEVGINDSRVRPSLGNANEVPTNEFSIALETLDNIVKTRNINKLVMIGLTPVNEKMTTPYKEDKIYLNKEILKYNKLIQKFSHSKEHFFVSLYNEFLAAGGPAKLTVDGLHPSSEGHALIAKRFEVVLNQFLRKSEKENE